MATIPLHGLRGEGKVALCDDQDFALLSQHRWTLSKKGYARTHIQRPGLSYTTIDMHRLLTDERGRSYKDHINSDRLDNRRSNLRLASNAENSRNRKVHSNNRLGLKGVSRTRAGNYRAVIHEGRKQHALGTYAHPVLAAVAYNAAAIVLYGPFARLNPLTPEQLAALVQELELPHAGD